MRIDSVRRATWERAKVLSGFDSLKNHLTHLADKDTESFYLKFGFQELVRIDGKMRIFIPMETIRAIP